MENKKDGKYLYIQYNISTNNVMRIDNIEMVPDEGNKIAKVEYTSDIDAINNYMTSKYINGEFIIDEERVKEQQLNILRNKRAPLLSAFDIYKSNVIIGVISPMDEEKQEINEWYNKILDLNEDAINNPPQLIQRYM